MKFNTLILCLPFLCLTLISPATAQKKKKKVFLSEAQLEKQLLVVVEKLRATYSDFKKSGKSERAVLMKKWERLLAEPAAFTAPFIQLQKEVEISWSTDSSLRFFSLSLVPFIVRGMSIETYYISKGTENELRKPEILRDSYGEIMECRPFELDGKGAWFIYFESSKDAKLKSAYGVVYWQKGQKLTLCEDCISGKTVYTNRYHHPFNVNPDTLKFSPVIRFNGRDTIWVNDMEYREKSGQGSIEGRATYILQGNRFVKAMP